MMAQACEEAAATDSGRFSGACRRRYSRVLNGFAGSFTDQNLRKVLGAYKDAIDYVERDTRMSLTGRPMDAGQFLADGKLVSGESLGTQADGQQASQQQNMLSSEGRRRVLPDEYNVTWGLDRIDQASAILDGGYHYDYTGAHPIILSQPALFCKMHNLGFG